MKDKKIFTELSPEEVKELFSMDMETEKHSIWNIFREYNSPRVGLHTYETKDGLRGYYEDGTRNRHGALQNWKTWFHLDIKPTEGGSIVCCRVIYNPYLAALFFMWLFSMLYVIVRKEWSALLGHAFTLIIMVVFMNGMFDDEDLIFQTVRKRLGVMEDTND